MTRFNRERGAALVTAIFVLVVIALLAAAMVRVLRFSDDSVAREVLSSRALMAADSGLDRTLGQLFPVGGVAQACAPLNWNFAASEEGLANCQVSVTCRNFTLNAITYYELQATGECGPNDDPAVRRVRVQARSL